MDDVVTSDLTKFGFRELDMAGDLLKAYAKNGSDFLGDKVNVFMNKNSGNVFLSDEDFNVGMLTDDGKVGQWFTCGQCGEEGFNEDGLPFESCNGYCSHECEDKNK